MLYKFKSKNAGDIIMLEANGRKVLEIIGKDAASKGIILPAQMPTAIAALEAAIANEESAAESAAACDDGVGLRQRVRPLIDMLQRSHKSGDEVVWGV